MTTPIERSLLITLRVAVGAAPTDSPTVAAARYHISVEPVMADSTHVRGIDDTCDLVRAWLETFVQDG